ncbi:MAG TPA: histidine kinase [Proteobacteria bacterium]|nr:histidine kinase [Pseudomonadota bacterium]
MASEIEELKARIAKIEAEIEDAKKRIPAHSVRPQQIMEIERMEDELAKMKNRLAQLLSEPNE